MTIHRLPTPPLRVAQQANDYSHEPQPASIRDERFSNLPTLYIGCDGEVRMITSDGPIKLTVGMCEHLLDLFHRERATTSYNDLHEAYVKAGGVPHAPRAVRDMFRDCPEVKS